MIPKIIHYCWLSNDPYPEVIAKCIETWKKHMPDYEFMLWDTKQFDVNSNCYVKQAFESKKYAFASDYIRLYALYHHGGIYLDSDIQVFRTFDNFLNCKSFTGFEKNDAIAAWIFGSEKGNPLFAELLSHYDNRKFIFPDGTFDMTPNVKPVTNTLIRHGLKLNGEYQELDLMTIFPRTFFCPRVPYDDTLDDYSENTYAEHLFNAGWVDTKQKEIMIKRRNLDKKYGKNVGLLYYGILTLKNEGIFSFLKQWKVRCEGNKNRRKVD